MALTERSMPYSEGGRIGVTTRIFFYKKPSKGPSSIRFLFQVQILVLKVS